MKPLEALAFAWLRWEKRCPVCLTERSPRPHHGIPDVLGITDSRHLLEIEVKRSMSDFRANNEKPHIQMRNAFQLKGQIECELWPRQYWYLVPPELAEKVLKELPPWAGLLRGPRPNEMHGLFSVVKAPVNQASKRLTTKECVKLAHSMSNQIYSMAEQLYRAGLKHDLRVDPGKVAVATDGGRPVSVGEGQLKVEEPSFDE